LIVGINDVDEGNIDHKVSSIAIAVAHQVPELIEIVLVEAVLRICFLLPLWIPVHVVLLRYIGLLRILVVILITLLILVTTILKTAVMWVIVIKCVLRMIVEVKLNIIGLCFEID